MKKYKREIEKLNNDALKYVNIEIIIFIVLYLVSIIFLKDIIRIMAIGVITLFAVVDLLHDINYYRRLKKNNDKLLEIKEVWYSKKVKKYLSDVIDSNSKYANSDFNKPGKGVITIFMHKYAIKQNNLYKIIKSQKPTK